MTDESQREERYIVFKVSDLGNSLKGDEIRRLALEYAKQRRLRGKEPLECVVVEKDWPEYEPTWKAIEARVTGAQPAPSEKDEPIRKAWARFSNALHRSPDAPYPGMSEAFEKHFSQSFTDREWRAESGTWAAAWKAAKNHGARAQPTLSIPEGWKKELFCIQHAMAMNSWNWESDASNDMKRAAYAAVVRLLAAAPEAKP